MKKAAILCGALLWMSVQAQAQTTPSPNTHAPEQNSQTFPQGEPSANADSVQSKLVKGTQSSRNARRSESAVRNKSTSVQTKTRKTVKTRKTSGNPPE
ncbi:hypothetical protein [Larkinella soli]|uniref:hypothetical protein n=1 Tax=Larkinella soli TaxID=1770527 RepID=UPI000FFC0C52|nr:hypothetical protein [Larkinella soli]